MEKSYLINTKIKTLKSDLCLIEKFASSLMGYELAHDYTHAARVRNWAVKIACSEHYENVYLAEIAALLHDIGLSIQVDRSKHGKYGAELARAFLYKNTSLLQEDIDQIAFAIENHNNISNVKEPTNLLKILVDADTLDLLGAVGISRALVSHYSKPLYFDGNIKGNTWGITSEEVNTLYGGKLQGSTTLVDQLNVQLSCVSILNTQSAKNYAKSLDTYMKGFIELLEKEVNHYGFDA